MLDSIPLANNVAQYGEGMKHPPPIVHVAVQLKVSLDFDNEVVEFCANKSLTVDQRLAKIRAYISVCC